MKKNQKIVPLFILTFIFIFGVVVFLFLSKNKVANNSILATVVDVVDRPNQAEDGYYGITAKDSNGQSYSINATGYLNTPLSPEENGYTCVDIPKVKMGDKISFNLPKVESQTETYDICYKRNLVGYYFKVE